MSEIRSVRKAGHSEIVVCQRFLSAGKAPFSGCFARIGCALNVLYDKYALKGFFVFGNTASLCKALVSGRLGRHWVDRFAAVFGRRKTA